VAALNYMTHGTSKLFLFPQGQQVPEMWSLVWFAGVIETVGGALLLVGLFSRPVAFLASGEMAVAYFTQHAAGGFWPIVNRGELVTLFCFIWLYICAAGPGSWSLDAVARRRAAGCTASRPAPCWRSGTRSPCRTCWSWAAPSGSRT
jgi:putative oxidoreductase